MRTTLKDIAKRVGVTSQLVSFYLNHPDTQRVAKATRDKIDKAVKELDYQPNGIARALITGKTKTIGLILGGFTLRKRGCFVHELMNAAKKRGYHLLVAITNYDQREERNILEYMLNQQVDGILYHLYLDPKTQIYSRLKKNRYPILMHVPQSNDDFNTIGHESSALKPAMQELVNQGHKRICFVGKEDDFDFPYFSDTCKKMKLPILFSPKESPLKLHEDMKNFDVTAAIFINSYLAQRYYELNPDTEVKSIVAYSLPFEYMADPRVVGVIYHDFHGRAEREIELMIEIISDQKMPVSCELMPSVFLDRKQWQELFESQCSSAEYEYFL